MKPVPFHYYRPSSASEAVEVMHTLGEDAKFIAGGQSLVPMMNLRLARPSALVDVSRLDELSYVRRDGSDLVIGAMTRHRTIETTSDHGVLSGFGFLPAAAEWIGHYPIRAVGTVGGSIAHSDPAAEWCIIATLLDAEIVVLGAAGLRSVPASSFFRGFLSTALAPDELVVEIRFPGPWTSGAVCEVARRRGDFAIVAVAVAIDLDETSIKAARIAVGGVHSTALRIRDAERVLEGESRTGVSVHQAVAEAGEIAASSVEPADDAHASAQLRRNLVSVLVERALRKALA